MPGISYELDDGYVGCVDAFLTRAGFYLKEMAITDLLMGLS